MSDPIWLLADWLLARGAAQSSLAVCGGRRAVAYKGHRYGRAVREPKAFALQPEIHALIVTDGALGRVGIVVPLRVDESRSSAGSAELDDLYEHALYWTKRILRRPELKVVYFDLHERVQVDGSSFLVAAVLGMVAYFERRAPKCAVLATGTITSSGAIGMVGELPRKVPAARREAGRKLILVPPGTDRDGTVEKAHIFDAAEEAFGDLHGDDLHASQRTTAIAQAHELAERVWAMQEIEAFLTRHDRGVVTVTGPLGAGKSVLLAQLLQRFEEREVESCAFLFGLATGVVEVDDAARSLLHQLRGAHDGLLSKLEVELSEPRERRVVVLDEVDQVRGGAQRIQRLFPRVWPCGLYLVVSSSHGAGWETLLRAVPPEVTRHDIDLSGHEPRVRADAVRLALCAGATDEAAAQERAARLQYNLLAIGQGPSDAARLCDQIFGALGVDTEEEDYTRTVLKLLVTAREPVGNDELRATGLEKSHLLKRACEHLATLVHRPDGRRSSRVHLLHEPLRRELEAYVGPELLVEGHALWAELPRKAPGLLYGLRHGPAHLIEAGRHDEAAALLCELPFVLKRVDARLLPTHLADLHDAIAASRRRSDEAQARGMLPSSEEQQLLTQLEDWRGFLLAEFDAIAQIGSAQLVQRALDAGAPSAIAAIVTKAYLGKRIPGIAIDRRPFGSFPRSLLRFDCTAPIRGIAPVSPLRTAGEPARTEGELVAVADASGLMIVDLDRGQRVASTSLADTVTVMEDYPECRVAFGTASGRIGIWAWHANVLVWSTHEADAAITALLCEGEAIVFGTRDGKVGRDPRDGSAVQMLADRVAPPVAALIPDGGELLAYRRDGRVQTIGGQAGQAHQTQGELGAFLRVCAREAGSARAVYVLETSRVGRSHRPGHDEELGTLASEVLALSGRLGTIAAGTIQGDVHVFEFGRRRVVAHDDGEILAVALLPNGKVAFGGESGLLRVVHAESSIEEPPGIVLGAELSPAGLVTLHETGVLLASTVSGQRQIASHAAGGIALVPCGAGRLASVGHDGTLCVLSADGSAQRFDAGDRTELLVSVDEQRLGAYSPTRLRLRALDLRTGSHRDYAAPDDVFRLESDGHSLVVGLTLRGGAVLWDLAQGVSRDLTCTADPARAVAFLEPGRLVLGYESGRLVEIGRDGRERGRYHDLTSAVVGICAYPGKQCAAADAQGHVALYADGCLRKRWCTERERTLGIVVDPAYGLLVPNGAGISRWNDRGEPLFQEALPSLPTAIATAENRLFTAHMDGSVHWRSLETGKLTAAWTGRAPITHLRPTDEGLWAVDRTGEIHYLVPLANTTA